MIIQSKTISLPLNDTGKRKRTEVFVPEATDGRVSDVIWDKTMDCAVSKEMGSSTVYTEAQARQLHMEEPELLQEGECSPADFISRCMTGKDAEALSGEGTPLEEYTSSQLERAVSRVKEQRSAKRQAVDGQVQKEREEQEALEEASVVKQAEAAGIPKEALLPLTESNLPETPENIARFTSAVSMTAQLSAFSSAAMKFFIDNQLSVTPENISGSVASARGELPQAKMAEDTFDEIRQQAETILAEGDIAITEESMQTVRWLYDNQLPITADNVRTFQLLEELKGVDLSILGERIAADMEEGTAPEKANLTKISPTEAHRRLEELRLSMTIEAARTMSAKGISLDVSNLQKIVEELKVQEQQEKEALLMETGLPVTAENVQIMSDTIQAAKNVLAAPVELFGITLEQADSQTLSQMSDSAAALTERYEKAGRTYEAVGTEVRRDLGDSITKAFRNVDDILEDLGMEITGMNQRAVRILAYNEMPLTEDNIVRMKEYDSRVTNLMNSLKPQVVAELIRKEKNPLEMTLDELTHEVETIQDEILPEDISFRKFLWKMDRQGDMTEEERQSMIGVYRLLDKVAKSDGAVIGQIVKEGKELSLSSLLSAVRSRKAAGMDYQIDDMFGGLEEAVTMGMSISEQIASAYGKNVVSDLQKSLSPEKLRGWDPDSDDTSLELLLENCREQEKATDMTDYYERMATEIRTAYNDPEGRLQAFLEELELPDTAANRMMAQNYLENGGSSYVNNWKKDESQKLQETFGTPESLEALYAEMDQTHEEELEEKKAGSDITYESVQSIARMAQSISFYKTLRKRQMYEVPIVTERGVTTCNVWIQNGDRAEKGSVEISMESEQFGKVQAAFKVNGKRVKGFVTAEKEESLTLCRQFLDDFEKDLEENGFTMESENLVQGRRNSLHVTDKENSTKNRDLYKIAQLFIVNVSRKEEEV